MLFFNLNSLQLCQTCKDETLRDYGPHKFAAGEVNEDELVKPEEIVALGAAPWQGNEEGDRYIQCDGCNGQWGPDA